MKITAHCLVKNEENFIWFAINSVIDFVDEILVWDHGSRDRTVDIVQSINNPKIKFKKVSGKVAELRQKMLKETIADWIFIPDGDEIWSLDSIKNLTTSMKGTKCDVIVSPNYLLIGDIFHYLEESAGKYKIADRVGHYNIRAMRNTPGLHVEGVYPNEAYVTAEGIKVQNLPKEKILFLEDRYLHGSFLPRSAKDRKKIKFEIGEEISKDYYYPEVFFRPRPDFISYPFGPMSESYRLLASLLTLFKKFKRRLA